MAFGIKREELNEWKRQVLSGQIAFLTHYWLHPRYPGITTVTKVGSSDVQRLIAWGKAYGLKKEWIHQRETFPHFDLLGEKQEEIMVAEKQFEQIRRFNL
jgi:hypothetical protein